MANQEQLDIVKQGKDVWNTWREQHPVWRPDLSGANLNNADLSGANLVRADLRKTNLNDTNLNNADLNDADLNDADLNRASLSGANLNKAKLSGANLNNTNLNRANLNNADLSRASLIGASLVGANLNNADLNRASLSGANLNNADLRGAYLYAADLSRAYLIGADLSGASLYDASLYGASVYRANLSGAKLNNADLNNADLNNANLVGADLNNASLVGADLRGANLVGADLSTTMLVRTNLTNAILEECTIYGISAWDIQLDGAKQINLTITPRGQPTITVDNLKVAQFIYLLLNNAEIRDAIDTLTTKSVLILGRFSPERKAVLNALRAALREQNYLPILFDFENPRHRDVTETVRTLAHLSRFILADLTDPSSIPLELDTIVPFLEIPLLPLLLETKREFSMFVSLTKYDWVLPIYKYKDSTSLLASFDNLLADAEKKVEELAIKKARRLIR